MCGCVLDPRRSHRTRPSSLADRLEFRSLDYKRLYERMTKPAFIFDGRNLLDHAALRAIGFSVYAIGKQ